MPLRHHFLTGNVPVSPFTIGSTLVADGSKIGFLSYLYFPMNFTEFHMDKPLRTVDGGSV